MAFKRIIIKKLTMGDYFYPLARGPWLKSILLPSPSDQHPGGQYTGESLSKMNNSMNILYTPKLLLMVSIGTRRSGLMKKPDTKDVMTLSL